MASAAVWSRGGGIEPRQEPMAVSLRVARLIALAVVYAVVAKAALGLDAVQGFATLVWPSTGIALAATLLMGPSALAAVAAGAFAANLWQGAPALAAVGIAVGNTGEAALGAFLLGRVGFRTSLDRFSDVFALIVFGAIVCTIVSATLGPLSLWLAGSVTLEHLPLTVKAWWLGDLYGALVVAPFLLTWRGFSRKWLLSWATENRRSGGIEALLLAGLIVGASVLAFVGNATPHATIFFGLPLLVWAAARFGQRGATAGVAFASFAAITGTALGSGPFAGGALREGLFVLQTYMAVVAVTLLTVGAATEERSRAMNELRLALSARDDFLSIASHELRTPLTTVILQLASLQRAFRREPASLQGDQTRRGVDRAMRQANRLSQLIDQLLDVSRISIGKLVLEPESVDLREVTREVVDRFAETAARAGSAIHLEATDTVEGFWDRTRLDQVVTNLVSNAIRYGAGHGIEVSVRNGASAATVSVRDGGVGIPAAALSSVFDRFQRATSKEETRGLGLGLYIARQIVEAHGGAIRVDSVVGTGSTFTVELPMRKLG